MRPEELPWYRWPWQRCRAVRERQGDDAWFGRCELEPHPNTVDHALDRALDFPRWSTRWTN
ncbi:MAG: hypothetical protein ACRDTZ_09120 [Pseudonocardiaceae bacterium]